MRSSFRLQFAFRGCNSTDKIRRIRNQPIREYHGYGDAAPAREIAAQREGLLTIPEYISTIDKIDQTRSSENL